MVFLLERIGKLVENLDELRYPQSVDIARYKMIKTTERFEDIASLSTDGWDDFNRGDLWGGHREYFWFETTVTIPESFAGQCVVYEMATGREGLWDATNPQFSFYVNGELRQGLDVNHRDVILTENAVAGQVFRLVLSAFTGDQNFSLYLHSRLRVLDRRTEQYYYDVSVPYHVALLLPEDSRDRIRIVTSLNDSLNLLDLRKPYSELYYSTLADASNQLRASLYSGDPDASEATVYCVGHTHIDVAWLWTLAVTEDKAVRSFSTVLELMRRYPEYLFMSSQPQLYAYVKKNAPDLYEQIRQRVKEGRWEVNGGMWVEADCNIASGESLVRQFIHGKRFFREEFDQDNNILWLPDVFGYSAALPQIMTKCGIPYFMTTKISWNEFNKMPYDTFLWEGIDGTKVLTHFVPARDFKAEVKIGSTETAHFTTYNGIINPSQIKGGWQRYQQKHINQEVLMSFGYGDGGGGPTADMLEQQRRLEKGLPGCPRTKMSTAKEFFDVLDQHVRDNKYLPTWAGELYLEYHRGTYTSMSRNKKYNRKSEFAALNTEWLAVLDQQLNGSPYPLKEIREQWEVILRNQFHDILPGSSIFEVYEDSKKEYEQLLSKLKSLSDKAEGNVISAVGAPQGSLVVFNPNGFDCSGEVEFDIPSGLECPAVYDGGVPLPTQAAGNGRAVFHAAGVPAKGYKAFTLRAESPEISGQMAVSPESMENAFFRIRLNNKGQFVSIFDKRAGREVLKPGSRANVLMSYEDKPHNYDAWDVNNYYVEKSWEIDDVQSIDVIECGDVRASLKIQRRYFDSTLAQIITIYRDTPAIRIHNQIDWKEKQIFVKALFPVDIHANEATFEIQYGNVTRPTHYNTSWDFARFEVCHHKWLDISEDDYGVSFLNDAKYGCSVHDSVVGLSMLKSAVHPNPEADKEYQEFTYVLYPHAGSWKDAGTVREAYKLNNPLTAVVKADKPGSLPEQYSFVRSENENVVIEVVKQAEDGRGIILRLYECFNRRTQAVLTFAQPVRNAVECDMLEQETDGPVTADGNRLSFTIKPYEIKTLRIDV